MKISSSKDENNGESRQDRSLVYSTILREIPYLILLVKIGVKVA